MKGNTALLLKLFGGTLFFSIVWTYGEFLPIDVGIAMTNDDKTTFMCVFFH